MCKSILVPFLQKSWKIVALSTYLWTAKKVFFVYIKKVTYSLEIQGRNYNGNKRLESEWKK